MEIKLTLLDRCDLVEFADKNKLVMEVHERVPADMGTRWVENYRYFAHFSHCEVKEGMILSGTFGDGATPEEAIREYTQSISGKLLVIDAMDREKRREIRAPILTVRKGFTLLL
jgi:hypothetical protein